MARYTGGNQVQGGYYWNPKSWAVEVVPEEGGRLQEAGADYVKVPFPALFVVVPLLGATFLMAMPVIGFAMVGQALVKRVTGGVKESAEGLAATMSPGWAAGEAHLTGKAPEKSEAAPAAKDEKLDALQGEIDARRDQK